MSKEKTLNEYTGDVLKDIGIPIKADTYSGNSKEYITVGYNEIPAGYADDEANFTRYLMDIHYFAPTNKNTVAIRGNIKKALRENGFTKPNIVNASDAPGQHFIFECEIIGRFKDDGED